MSGAHITILMQKRVNFDASSRYSGENQGGVEVDAIFYLRSAHCLPPGALGPGHPLRQTLPNGIFCRRKPGIH